MISAPADVEEYSVTSGGYLKRARELLESQRLQDWFYSAFELRCALERTLIDFLCIVLHPIPPDAHIRSKVYKPRDVLALVRNTDPQFEKRLRFSSLLLQADGVIKSDTKFDFDWLCTAHETLNGYMHHQKEPSSTVASHEWSAVFYALLKETQMKLLDMWKSNRGYLKEPNPKGDAVYALFLSGKHTDEEIINMLRISNV